MYVLSLSSFCVCSFLPCIHIYVFWFTSELRVRFACCKTGSLSSWCPVIVVWIFLAVPWFCLQFMIVVFLIILTYFFKPSSKIFLLTVRRRCFFCGSLMSFTFCFCYAFVRVCGHLLGKDWPLVFVCGVKFWRCHFPIWILGQVWCLIVSIPDLCPFLLLLCLVCSLQHCDQLLGKGWPFVCDVSLGVFLVFFFVVFLLSDIVSWVWCGTRLYWFLIFCISSLPLEVMSFQMFWIKEVIL